MRRAPGCPGALQMDAFTCLCAGNRGGCRRALRWCTTSSTRRPTVRCWSADVQLSGLSAGNRTWRPAADPGRRRPGGKPHSRHLIGRCRSRRRSGKVTYRPCALRQAAGHAMLRSTRSTRGQRVHRADPPAGLATGSADLVAGDGRDCAVTDGVADRDGRRSRMRRPVVVGQQSRCHHHGTWSSPPASLSAGPGGWPAAGAVRQGGRGEADRWFRPVGGTSRVGRRGAGRRIGATDGRWCRPGWAGSGPVLGRTTARLGRRAGAPRRDIAGQPARRRTVPSGARLPARDGLHSRSPPGQDSLSMMRLGFGDSRALSRSVSSTIGHGWVPGSYALSGCSS